MRSTHETCCFSTGRRLCSYTFCTAFSAAARIKPSEGIALERRSLVQDAIIRGELVQLTSITAPYPWPYWLVTAQPKEEKPEVGLFVAWLDEEVAAWRRAVSAVESNQP